MAASTAALEVTHTRALLAELGLQPEGPTTLLVDNSSAIDLAHDPMHRGRAMHIERRHLKVRELVRQGTIDMKWISTADNFADMLTKPLNPRRFATLRTAAGLGQP